MPPSSGAAEANTGKFASRFTGSSDLYQGGPAVSSINFIRPRRLHAAHLVSDNANTRGERRGEHGRSPTTTARELRTALRPTTTTEINAVPRRQHGTS